MKSDQIKGLLSFLGLAIIFGFFASWIDILSIKIFTLNNDFLTKGLEAFSGAFFAFLFIRLAEFLNKLYGRQTRNFNSLVNLESHLNEVLGIVHDNIYLIPSFISSITSGNIYWSKLRQIPIYRDPYKELYNLDLLNHFFSYNQTIRRINDDTENIMQGYGKLEAAYIDQHIKREDYLVNATNIARQLKTIEVFMKELENQTEKILAEVRIRVKKDTPFGTKLMHFFYHSQKVSQIELEIELGKIKQELMEVSKESKEEIENLVAKNNL